MPAGPSGCHPTAGLGGADSSRAARCWAPRRYGAGEASPTACSEDPSREADDQPLGAPGPMIRAPAERQLDPVAPDSCEHGRDRTEQCQPKLDAKAHPKLLTSVHARLARRPISKGPPQEFPSRLRVALFG